MLCVNFRCWFWVVWLSDLSSMPSLDIATAQASLLNHLGPLSAQSLRHCKAFSSPFTFGDVKRLLSVGKSFQFPKLVNPQGRNEFWIKAVSTLEPKFLVDKEDGQKKYKNAQLDFDSDSSTIGFESTSGDWNELDERERLRRMRISKANKGNTPWNKGRKHSAETLQRIRERTRLAMQDPKVQMKLVNLGHAQSIHTRIKIGVGVRMRRQKCREKQMVQETCYFEWQNLIADASRRGYVGEEELQWDSYKVLSEKLELEWQESFEQRKTMARPKGSRRAPKSPEQRRKIAEAITAKWADPDYRERVCSALAKYHGIPAGAETKRRRKPSGTTESTGWEPGKKRTSKTNNFSDSYSPIERLRLRRSKMPLYKDPLASSKLEMIKNIRAQRAATETKKTEAIEQAWLLIAEAEKAAKALEAAAAALKSPVAQASLVETRKLIAEAIQSIKSVDTAHFKSNENDGHPSIVPTELVNQVENEPDESNGDVMQAELRGINGTKILASSKEDLNFPNLTFHELLNGEKELLHTSSNGYDMPAFNLGSIIEQSSLPQQLGHSEPNGNPISKENPQPNGSIVQHMKEEVPSKSVGITKKWVREGLVEVTEGD